jgi:hypothetical protein
MCNYLLCNGKGRRDRKPVVVSKGFDKGFPSGIGDKENLLAFVV